MRPIQFLTIVQYATSFLLAFPLAAVSAYAAEQKCNFRHVSIETSKSQIAAYTSGAWSPLREKAGELARKGRLNESETYWTQAYEALLKKRGERDHETLEAMSTVAFLNMVHGKDDEAERLFGKLIPILDQSGPIKYITSEAYLYFYHFLRSRNRIVEARKVLARVATINELINASPTTQAETFAELGAMHAVYDNNKPEAIACFKKATSLFSASFQSGNTFTTALAFSRIYNQIMFFALDLGDKTYAEEAGRKSVDLLQNANQGVYISLAQHNLAKIFLSVGKGKDAEKFAQSALTVARRAKIDRIAEVQYLATLSRAVGQSMPDLSKAMSLSEEAFNIALDLRGVSDDAPQPRREPGHLRAYMSEVYGLSEYLYPAVSAFIDASWQSAASGVPEEQIKITEKAFEAIQYISLSEGASAIKDASLRRSTSDGPSAALLRQIQDLKAQLKVARREVLEGLASGDNDAVGSQIEWSKRAEERIRLLGGQLERADPGLFNYIYPRSLTVSAVRSRLEADEGLLLVTSVDDDVHTFVVTKDRLAWNRFEGGASSIKQLVEELLCGVDEANCSLGVSPTSEFHQGSEIYSMVIKPTLAALKDINSLYVSLSGPIASVPLGILPMDGTPGSEVPSLYLSDRFAMTVVPTVASLDLDASGRSIRPPLSERSFVGYGAPLLSGDTKEARGFLPDLGVTSSAQGSFLGNPQNLRNLPSVPGAAQEVLAAASLFSAPAERVHVGSSMTERAFKSDVSVREANVLLIATHGLMPNDLPELREPGLVFTPPDAPQADDDGYLSSSEVALLSFSADVVLLSACNTANHSAGDLSSLARAFLYAGARSVLGSHWRVSDDATAALTKEFFRAAQSNPNLTRSQAFQAGMRAVRTGRRLDGSPVDDWDADWVDPKYWGPFVLISGDNS